MKVPKCSFLFPEKSCQETHFTPIYIHSLIKRHDLLALSVPFRKKLLNRSVHLPNSQCIGWVKRNKLLTSHYFPGSITVVVTLYLRKHVYFARHVGCFKTLTYVSQDPIKCNEAFFMKHSHVRYTAFVIVFK